MAIFQNPPIQVANPMQCPSMSCIRHGGSWQVSICLPILRLARPHGIIFYCHYPAAGHVDRNIFLDTAFDAFVTLKNLGDLGVWLWCLKMLETMTELPWDRWGLPPDHQVFGLPGGMGFWDLSIRAFVWSPEKHFPWITVNHHRPRKWKPGLVYDEHMYIYNV